MRRLVGAVLVGLALTGCQGSNGTPGPGNGVALDMTVNEVTCRPHARATACFRVTITNRGYAAGGGPCVLTGVTHRTTSQGDTSESGQRFTIASLAAGASITRTSVWRSAPRDDYYGICDPGLRS